MTIGQGKTHPDGEMFADVTAIGPPVSLPWGVRVPIYPEVVTATWRAVETWSAARISSENSRTTAPSRVKGMKTPRSASRRRIASLKSITVWLHGRPLARQAS